MNALGGTDGSSSCAEEETGLSVIVTNGNHDINNFNGVTFESGRKAPARPTSPEEFHEIYRNLGYDLAYHTFSSDGAGQLSYSVQLDGGYRLIVLDVCKYSADATDDGEDSHQTDGAIPDSNRIFLRRKVQRSTAVTSDERWARTRFTAVHAAVMERRKDLSKIAADQAAFQAQKDTAGGRKTMYAFLWKLEGEAYDQAHPKA